MNWLGDLLLLLNWFIPAIMELLEIDLSMLLRTIYYKGQRNWDREQLLVEEIYFFSAGIVFSSLVLFYHPHTTLLNSEFSWESNIRLHA